MGAPFPVVTASGSHYECGYQHGEQASDLVRRNIDYYFGWWSRNLKMDSRQIKARADDVIRIIKGFDAGLLEEMRGVADAADVGVEEIVSINGRYELAWASPEQLMGGCTCIAALPSATETGKTILAQNWDYRVGVRDTCIALRVKTDDCPEVILHTEAGIIGHKGMNSAGLALGINAMVSDVDRLGESVPFLLVCRKVLMNDRFSEAVRDLLNARRSVSYNVMLAGEGVAVDLEAHPLDVSIINPEAGVLVHANHFVGERAVKVRDSFVLSEPSSVNRHIVAHEKMRGRRDHSLDSFKEILTDHLDHPTSICYHPNPVNHPDHREETVASVIMVPEDRLFMATKGPPCANKYHEIPFSAP